MRLRHWFSNAFFVFIASGAPIKAPVKVSLWFCDGYHDINAVKERGCEVSKSVYDTGMDWFKFLPGLLSEWPDKVIFKPAGSSSRKQTLLPHRTRSENVSNSTEFKMRMSELALLPGKIKQAFSSSGMPSLFPALSRSLVASLHASEFQSLSDSGWSLILVTEAPSTGPRAFDK